MIHRQTTVRPDDDDDEDDDDDDDDENDDDDYDDEDNGDSHNIQLWVGWRVCHAHTGMHGYMATDWLSCGDGQPTATPTELLGPRQLLSNGPSLH